MKKLIIVIFTVILLISVTTISANALFEPSTDYSKLMISAAVKGDIEAGIAAAESRNEKIITLGLSKYCQIINFDDFYLLAKIITKEYGSSWLLFDNKMIVGEILLNRAYGPEFGNTIYECVYEPGQYANVNTDYFKELLPFEDCCLASLKLLNGERVLNDPTAVFQSGQKLGSETIIQLIDPTGYYNPTYIGRSYYPELYK